MVTSSIASLVELRVDQLMFIAQEQLGVRLRRPKVDYDLRGTGSGCASLVGMRVSFNPTLLSENLHEFVDQTVGHEVAHILVFQRHGIVRYNHGKQWQTFMRMLNVPIKIDHTYDVSTILGKERKSKPALTYTEDDVAVLYQRYSQQTR